VVPTSVLPAHVAVARQASQLVAVVVAGVHAQGGLARAAGPEKPNLTPFSLFFSFFLFFPPLSWWLFRLWRNHDKPLSVGTASEVLFEAFDAFIKPHPVDVVDLVAMQFKHQNPFLELRQQQSQQLFETPSFPIDFRSVYFRLQEVYPLCYLRNLVRFLGVNL
jgi:hypothetical protein